MKINLLIQAQLSPRDDEYKTSDNMIKVKKELEKILNGTQTEFVRTNSNNYNIVVGFKSATLRDVSFTAINSSDLVLRLGYTARCSNKILPKISLFNVPADILEEVDENGHTAEVRESKKQVIVGKILAKNPDIAQLKNIGHTLEVVYLHCNDVTQLLTIGLKVSPAIKSILDDTQQGSVY